MSTAVPRLNMVLLRFGAPFGIWTDELNLHQVNIGFIAASKFRQFPRSEFRVHSKLGLSCSALPAVPVYPSAEAKLANNLRATWAEI